MFLSVVLRELNLAVFASICVNFVLCLTCVNVPKLLGNIYNFQTLELELGVKCTPMWCVQVHDNTIIILRHSIDLFILIIEMPSRLT